MTLEKLLKKMSKLIRNYEERGPITGVVVMEGTKSWEWDGERFSSSGPRPSSRLEVN